MPTLSVQPPCGKTQSDLDQTDQVEAPCNWQSLLESDISSLPVVEVPIGTVFPSPENNRIYDPPTEQEIDQLADSLSRDGQLEPGVMAESGDLLSGHRRYLGLQAPVKTRCASGSFRACAEPA